MNPNEGEGVRSQASFPRPPVLGAGSSRGHPGCSQLPAKGDLAAQAQKHPEALGALGSPTQSSGQVPSPTHTCAKREQWPLPETLLSILWLCWLGTEGLRAACLQR